MRIIFPVALVATFLASAALAQRSSPGLPFAVLHPDDYHHYVNQFTADEREATGQQPADEWPWIAANVPLFNSSNKQFEEMYYFRWYSFAEAR